MYIRSTTQDYKYSYTTATWKLGRAEGTSESGGFDTTGASRYKNVCNYSDGYADGWTTYSWDDESWEYKVRNGGIVMTDAYYWDEENQWYTLGPKGSGGLAFTQDEFKQYYLKKHGGITCQLHAQQQTPEEVAEEAPWLLFDTPLLATDITLGGMPLWDCTLENVAEHFPDGRIQSEHQFFTEDFNLQTDVAPVYVSFTKTEFRHFGIGMSIEDVLKELGLSEIGKNFAMGASELLFDIQGEECTSATRMEKKSEGAYSENITCVYNNIPEYSYMIFAFGFQQERLVHMEASVLMFEEEEPYPTASLSGVIRFNDDVYPELKNIDHTKEARPAFGLFLDEPVTLTVGAETYTVSELTVMHGEDEDLNGRQAEYVDKHVTITGTISPFLPERGELTTWMADGREVQGISHNCNGPLSITMETVVLG